MLAARGEWLLKMAIEIVCVFPYRWPCSIATLRSSNIITWNIYTIYGSFMDDVPIETSILYHWWMMFWLKHPFYTMHGWCYTIYTHFILFYTIDGWCSDWNPQNFYTFFPPELGISWASPAGTRWTRPAFTKSWRDDLWSNGRLLGTICWLFKFLKVSKSNEW